MTVRVTYQAWNEYRPWQKAKPRNRTCLGTVMPGNRILVPAAYLDDATLIQLEKFDRPPRIPARIVHCDNQVGLAILTTDEPGFFDNLKPVDLAETADAEGEDFYCVAWKSSQLTFSSCRWSQVKVFKSSVPYFGYAGIYFITDLKSGGRGEPVFSGDRMIGIARSQSGNRITVIPAELIQAYLHAVDLPEYPSFGRLGIDYQYNRGKAQAAHFGQTGAPAGILIRSCFPNGSADGILLPDDILLELDGHAINSQGDYLHPRYGLMGLNLIATDGHYAGDVLTAKVLRNKEETTVEVPLKNTQPSAALIPAARPDLPPPYLVAGGFVFRELDVPYLKAWGKDWENNIPPTLRILNEMRSESPTPEQQRLIVLTDVFPDDYNLGYHEMAQNIVKSVNGRSIDSIREMEEAFQHPEDGFHVIEFLPGYGTSKVILDAAPFKDATAAIMEKYQIPTRIRLNP
ncbi:PDZ domain-containing protein [Pontiella sulfatireligans]|uniref:PDZ domain-containing protein n=1 Tax=Pontiella sulfatireligans TaxID=2750658 RepID=UPI00109D265D|nr:hypothetical protein [Pontiella sulfatireligans]